MSATALLARREGGELLSVRAKPGVESARILPVGFGMPLLIGPLFGWRRLRSR